MTKIILPLVFQVGEQTEMIVTHLREVHYWLAIACDIWKTLASMSAQIILEHNSGCKVKLHKKKSKMKEQEKPA